EERQDEDLGVPEGVAAVAGTGQGPGPDGRGVALRVAGGDEVVDGEAQRLLGGRVAVDHDVAVVPPVAPRPAMPTPQGGRIGGPAGVLASDGVDGAVDGDHPLDPPGPDDGR